MRMMDAAGTVSIVRSPLLQRGMYRLLVALTSVEAMDGWACSHGGRVLGMMAIRVSGLWMG